MEFVLTDQVLQLITWFMVLLAFIVGLYCLVINFGGLLNRFVFLFTVIAAIRHMALALMLDPAGASWAHGLNLLNLGTVALLRPMQLIITLLLLKPNWWRDQFHWLIKSVIGVSLLFPLGTLADVVFDTDLYYRGIAETYSGGYISTDYILPGHLFTLFNFLSILPSRILTFLFALYVAVGDKQASSLTRKMAWLILASFSAFIVTGLIPQSPTYELAEALTIVGVGSFGYLAAIFLKIFSQPPFRQGSLQTRLLAVVIATAVPILIAVGLLAQLSPLAAWSGIILGAVMLVVLIWLTIRYSIQPINALTRTVTAIAAGDLDRLAPVESEDEIGTLARAFNSMTGQLRGLINDLEARVLERTRELERRAVYLETSSRVGQHVTSILDQDTLLNQVVDLIQVGFGYYFVGVWLLEEKQEALTLQASAGRSGKVTKQRGTHLPLDRPAIVVGACKMGLYRLVNNVAEAPDYRPDEALSDTRSALALPLRISGQIIGILDIQSDDWGAFSQDDAVVFQTLADEIAIAIRNAQLYRGEQRRRQLAEALEETGRELSSNLDLHEIPGLILDQLANVVPYERCSILLQQGEALQIIAQRGFPADRRLADLQVPIRRGDVYQQVVGTSRPVLLDNVTEDPNWQQVDWLPLNLSWLGVPLISKDRVIGMISLTRPEAGAFSAEDARLVSAFAGHAAIALENASLYDEITNFNEGLEQTVMERTEELNQAYQNLERLDQTKSDFIKVVAHELRTPLTVIRGYAQVLRDVRPAASQDAENRMLLDGILSGVDRLREVVDSMLDLTRLENEVLRMYKEETSLADIIEQIRTQFEAALHERHLTLTIDHLDDLPLIQADPDLLHKVFYHLIMNAIKYVPDGGAIMVSGKTIVAAEETEPAVEIVVSDTGIGIDPAHHELIFEKFYQTGEMSVHSSGRTKYKGGGPGLGLAIVQGIVSAHHGKIWVESGGHNETTCPGSHFHVQLPLNGRNYE